MMAFIWNCRLCKWTQYIDFLGVIRIIVPVANAQTGSVVLNICFPPLPFRTLTSHQWERSALKLWTADTENTAAETLQRSVQVAVLNQCVRIMSRCITVRNHISIRIIKKSSWAAKCTLSSVSLPLYEKPLCLFGCALSCHWLMATFRTKQMIAKKMLISTELCVWTELFILLHINSKRLFYSHLCGWPVPKPMYKIVLV